MELPEKLPALVLAALAATWAAAADPAASGRPRARVVNDHLNLGERTRIEEAIGRFEIRNDGDAPLRILDAQPSCGCTVVSFDGEIPPGGSGFVEAEVDIATVRGPVWNQIHVLTNDPDQPKLVLDLRTRVVGGVLVLPQDDVFLHGRAGRLPSGRLVLRKKEGEEGELQVEDIRSSRDWIVARARPVHEAKPAGGGLPETFAGDWVLELAVVGEPEYGRHEESVWFDTGLPAEPQVMVPVVLDLRPPVNVSMRRVELSAAKPRETLVLSVREGADPSWLRVEAVPPELKIDLEELGGRYFKLHISGTPTPGREADAAVLLHVGEETMRVPVTWLDAPARER